MSNFGRGSKGGKDTLEARKAERLRTRYRRSRRDRDSYRRFLAIQSLRGSCKGLSPAHRRILAHKAHLLHNQFARNVYAMSHQGWTECMAILHETHTLYSRSQPHIHKAVTRAINKVFSSFSLIATSLQRRAIKFGIYVEMCKGKTKNFYPEGEELLNRIASKSATWFKKRVCKVEQIRKELMKLSLGVTHTVKARRINERESWNISELASDDEIRANAPVLLFEPEFSLNRLREELAPRYAKQAKINAVADAKKQAWTDAYKNLESMRRRQAEILGRTYEEHLEMLNAMEAKYA